jgi:hypothetical protein
MISPHHETSTGQDSRPEWGGFLRALLDTLDAHMQPDERAVLLRAIGGQLAALSPLPPESSLSGLEARINERLAEPQWGTVSIALDSDGPALVLTHLAPPSLPTASDQDGAWFGPVLEGLHGGWIASQPGAESEVEAHLVSATRHNIVLRYGA